MNLATVIVLDLATLPVIAGIYIRTQDHLLAQIVA